MKADDIKALEKVITKIKMKLISKKEKKFWLGAE